MKKLLLMIAVMALVCTVVSCGGSDEPGRRGDGVFIVNTPMINHMYNTVTGAVIGVGETHNKLTLDTVHHTAALVLSYNDGSDHTVTYNDLTAKAKGPLFYELRSPSDASFYGYVYLREGDMRYRYTTADGIRIISTIAEVFFYKTQNTVEYSDATGPTSMENVYYNFIVDPAKLTAIVKVGDIVHAKDVKYFEDITAMSVPVTLTNTGYIIAGQNIKTTAHYKSVIDSTGSRVKTTTDYPFKTFNATVDLLNDHMEAHYMLGEDATVTASGRTYPDYTAY